MSDELNSDARHLVDLAREARTPGDQDKLRIAERLAIPLAAGVIAGSAAGVAKAAGAAEVAGAGAGKAAGAGLFGGSSLLSSVGAKIAAVITVAGVGTAVMVSNLETPPAAPRAPAPVLAVPAAPAPQPAPPLAVVEEIPAAPVPTADERKAPANSPTVHGTTPAHELAQEAALLHEAQAAWRAGQSAQALQLANQHAQRFPRSQLADERDVLRVLSLCKLGQVSAAKQVGTRLLRKAKGSPWYQSVADSCAAD
ncbi:MAG TPA: hypothetical protein VHO25_02495 [Polyangiaceae bacterium]|nr:hypothetical protein [Polyangiaceae bacterium]